MLLTIDLHTHSDVTDGADAPETMAYAARGAGLDVWALSDHVRADSTWVDDYVSRVRRIRVDGLEIRCAVEAKILDRTGHLDLPPLRSTLDHVLVADHQFPGPGGPMHPREVGRLLREGGLRPADVLETLVTATAGAIATSPFPPVVAHLFSLLPKTGLGEDWVTGEHLDTLAAACRAADARVEINEKWRCPSPAVAAGLVRRGVDLVVGSDAHAVGQLGAGAYVRAVADELAVAV